MKLKDLLQHISKLPWKAQGSGVYNSDGLIADCNTSCGLTRGMDLCNAEFITLAASWFLECIKTLEELLEDPDQEYNGVIEKYVCHHCGEICNTEFCEQGDCPGHKARKLLGRIQKGQV